MQCGIKSWIVNKTGSSDYLGGGQSKVLTFSGVLRVVQGQESLLQVFIVAVAVGSSLQRSDLVVEAFQRVTNRSNPGIPPRGMATMSPYPER